MLLAWHRLVDRALSARGHSVHDGGCSPQQPQFDLVAADPREMSQIVVCPLGAGQDVGRSCILLTIGGRTIMLDCGVHMGLRDAERFPDFRAASPSGDLTSSISAVIVTHFHLDHCGALPILTEQWNYAGPVIMTFPTRALCPVMLEDYRYSALFVIPAAHTASSADRTCALYVEKSWWTSVGKRRFTPRRILSIA